MSTQPVDFLRGYRDASDRKPGSHEPHPNCCCDRCLQYWDGWRAGIHDSTAAILRHKIKRYA